MLELALEHLEENGTPYFILYSNAKKVTDNFQSDDKSVIEKRLKYGLGIIPEGTEILLKSYITPQSKNSPYTIVLREGDKKSSLDGLFPSVGDLSNPQLSGVALGLQYGMQMASLEARNLLLQQKIEEPQKPSLFDIAKEKAPDLLQTAMQSEAGQAAAANLMNAFANLINVATSKLSK